MHETVLMRTYKIVYIKSIIRACLREDSLIWSPFFCLTELCKKHRNNAISGKKICYTEILNDT